MTANGIQKSNDNDNENVAYNISLLFSFIESLQLGARTHHSYHVNGQRNAMLGDCGWKAIPAKTRQ
jgi:hypothetical protein